MEDQPEIRMQKYYLKHEILDLDEDLTHEFKAHRNITIGDIPSKCVLGDDRRLSRQPIDRTLAGFLNTAAGGTVYIGVSDEGMVEGLVLNCYQKEHIRVAVSAALSDLSPPVEPHRYEIRFVPVVNPADDVEKVMTKIMSLTPKPPIYKPHVLQIADYCWCDMEARADFDNGIMNASYITEIEIMPWNPKDTRNENAIGVLKAPSVHEFPDGSVYMRFQASVRKFTMEDVIVLAKERVAAGYKNILKKSERDVEAAKAKAVARTINLKSKTA